MRTLPAIPTNGLACPHPAQYKAPPGGGQSAPLLPLTALLLRWYNRTRASIPFLDRSEPAMPSHATLRKLLQARELIHDCFHKPLTLDDVAAEAQLSPW